MAIKLFDHQLEALDHMKNGCILHGGVGSGKTITSLAYYYIQNKGSLESLKGEKYVYMSNPKDLYVITTAQKRDTHDWEDEMTPFLLSPNPKSNGYSNKVIVDSWNNIKKYEDVKGSFIIFDEKYINGYGTWAKSFIKMAKNNEWILLSATPGDKWVDYIAVFVAHGWYRNKTDFMERHVLVDYRNKFPQIKGYLETKRLEKLRNYILVDMDFYREAKQVHEDVYCKYDVAKYKMIAKDRWNFYENKPIKNISELCFLMRRVVNSDESRQVLLLEILEDHPKAIVFYNFNYELDILREICSIDGVEMAEWNGEHHDPIPKSDNWVYLVQYAAGNAGWNCVTTDTIIFYSQNYSYTIMTQAAGRIDRLNTPYKKLYYYHLKSRSGIDLGISNALKNKKKFNETRFINRGIG